MVTSILIVKLSSMGDVIHTLPAAQAIRAAHPEAKLGWAIERPHAALLRGQPWLDEVIEWDGRNAASFIHFVARLRRTRWDVAIDFQGLLRSGVVTWLSGARRRIGHVPAREMAHWFYNDRVPRQTMDRHAVERSLELAGRLGGRFAGTPMARPYVGQDGVAGGARGRQLFPLYPTESDHAAVAAWCRQHHFDAESQCLVILNPHCRREANRWPASKFTELARRLLAYRQVRVALAGGRVARPLCDAVAAPLGEAIWRADGHFSLLGSASLFSRARVVVTGDTGPMHLAAAVETPVVAMFGPSDCLRTGPYASDAVVLSRSLSCTPCLGRCCRLNFVLPLCMDELDVDEVLTAVVARLDELDAGPMQRKSA